MPLDAKGRCCGRKPIIYKRWQGAHPPQRYCTRCDRAYELPEDEDDPIANWAWDSTHSIRRTGTAAGTRPGK